MAYPTCRVVMLSSVTTALAMNAMRSEASAATTVPPTEAILHFIGFEFQDEPLAVPDFNVVAVH